MKTLCAMRDAPIKPVRGVKRIAKLYYGPVEGAGAFLVFDEEEAGLVGADRRVPKSRSPGSAEERFARGDTAEVGWGPAGSG